MGGAIPTGVWANTTPHRRSREMIRFRFFIAWLWGYLSNRQRRSKLADMKPTLLCVLLCSSLSLARGQTKTCTAVKDAMGNTMIDCSDLTSATVTPQSTTGNISTYSVTTTAPPPHVTPPAAQPIPLPALAIQPSPPINTDLMAMAMIAASNKAPSSRQVRKYCKKHPGESWVWRNFYGTVVAQGECSH
jgi:hypothetical protein